MAIKPNMLYGLECWIVDRKIEQSIRVMKLRMLRWRSGVTRDERIKNENVRCSINEASIVVQVR